MIYGKRHFIIAVLILALGAAVYLNWQFSPSEKLVTEAAGNYVQFEDDLTAQYAAADSHDAVSAADTADQPLTVEASVHAGFFEAARADRLAARTDASRALEEITSDPSMSESQKNEAVRSMAKLAMYSDTEASIETLVKAKGYSDCVAVISDTQVNIIIPAGDGGITASDAAVIKDIVMGQTDMPASAIKIVEAK